MSAFTSTKPTATQEEVLRTENCLSAPFIHDFKKVLYTISIISHLFRDPHDDACLATDVNYASTCHCIEHSCIVPLSELVETH